MAIVRVVVLLVVVLVWGGGVHAHSPLFHSVSAETPTTLTMILLRLGRNTDQSTHPLVLGDGDDQAPQWPIKLPDGDGDGNGNGGDGDGVVAGGAPVRDNDRGVPVLLRFGGGASSSSTTTMIGAAITSAT